MVYRRRTVCDESSSSSASTVIVAPVPNTMTKPINNAVIRRQCVWMLLYMHCSGNNRNIPYSLVYRLVFSFLAKYSPAALPCSRAGQHPMNFLWFLLSAVLTHAVHNNAAVLGVYCLFREGYT